MENVLKIEIRIYGSIIRPNQEVYEKLHNLEMAYNR